MLLIVVNCLVFIWLFSVVTIVQGHGRMFEPPARNTMWRFGFPTFPNYEDSELFCGGIKVQWQDNNGKCGVCGDPANGRRDHETGGVQARNITTRSYPPGSVIDVAVDIVTNHGGRFIFQMCWRDSWDVKETENCFETLKLKDGSDTVSVNNRPRAGLFVFPVQLPAEKTCKKCILRWHWLSGNNWGLCPNGTYDVGCGPQETYRNCADIAVTYDLGIRGPHLLEPSDYRKRFLH
ncbi:uncharacterized protein LOC128392932 [Panonychus citri]|uniref:uncharacterized protein LOC128392932 n=1 Tax=Panonychus citri TaxID=50023 RepID=UPI00230768E9|nr:uncharacterized protein LOC128392932 [Panonychus citri]